eukprot:m.700203 g.700203  ORF g.700203 m.700203 type:complete len:663 (-) comp58701_c0_seq10:106-2094(-)
MRTSQPRNPPRIHEGTAPTLSSANLLTTERSAKERSASVHSVGWQETTRHAILIQKWVRRHQAIKRYRLAQCWTMFQAGEYNDEAGLLELCRFYDRLSALARHSEETLSVAPAALSTARLSDRRTATKFMDSAPFLPALFRAAKLDSKIDLAFFHATLEKLQRRECLPHRQFVCVVQACCEVLWAQPNIRAASVARSKRITVVGDLHGSFKDLLIIFQKNGLPSDSNPYIFNGDFVDRGDQALEIITALFLLQILYPFSVFLNRGNHEDFLLNKRYGFEKEVLSKYGQSGSAVLKAITYAFTLIPLGTVIDKKIAVVHAGVCDGLDLSLVQEIDRTALTSIMQLAQTFNKSDDQASDEIRVRHYVVNLMWSDPWQMAGSSFNTQRGGGILFGPDVSRRFLEANKFSLIVRSHQCIQSGYEFTHNGDVLTIFSASDYYSEGSNDGAIVVFDEVLKPTFITYNASQEPRLSRKESAKKVMDAIELDALQHLLDVILKHQVSLRRQFRLLDSKNSGVVTVDQWVKVMSTLAVGSVPWFSLSRKFAQRDEKNNILYESSFNRKAIEARLGDESGVSSSEPIYSNLAELEFIFRFIDADHSGDISREEISQVCGLLNALDPQGEQFSTAAIEKIASGIDLTRDGSISFNEFIEAFRLQQSSRRPTRS